MYFGGFIAYLESCRKITSILKEPEFLQSRCSGQHPRSLSHCSLVQASLSACSYFSPLVLRTGSAGRSYRLPMAPVSGPRTPRLLSSLTLSHWVPSACEGHIVVWLLSVREQQQKWYRVLGSTASIQGSLFPQWISSLCGGMPLKVTALGFSEPQRVSFTDASCEGGALSCLHGALCVCSICVYGNHQIGLQIHQGGISLNHWSWGRVQSCETEVCFPLPPAKLGLGCTAHALSNFVQHEAHKAAALYIQYLHF